jgi:nucleoside-diphosphate-sugar epimerase
VIFVTGASGFLGTAVLGEIALRGRVAFGTVRRTPSTGSPHHLREIDLTLASDALAEHMEASGATTLIHLALVNRLSFDTTPSLAESQTEIIDRFVIAACKRSSTLRRVIIVSSSAVYGALQPGEQLLSEARGPAPNGQYGRSKLAQEQRWERANLQHPVVVARVFNITGPGEPPTLVCGALAERLAKLAEGSQLPLKSSESVRDFSDVRDAAAALLGIADMEGAPPSKVNVCSGKGITISDLARMIIKASGREVILAADGAGGESRSVGDPQLLTEQIGWRRRFSLQESASAVWSSTR